MKYFFKYISVTLIFILSLPLFCFADSKSCNNRLYIQGLVADTSKDMSTILFVKNCDNGLIQGVRLKNYNNYKSYITLIEKGDYEIYKAFPIGEEKEYAVEYVRFVNTGQDSTIQILIGNPNEIEYGEYDTQRINELGEQYENYPTNILDNEGDYEEFNRLSIISNNKINNKIIQDAKEELNNNNEPPAIKTDAKNPLAPNNLYEQESVTESVTIKNDNFFNEFSTTENEVQRNEMDNIYKKKNNNYVYLLFFIFVSIFIIAIITGKIIKNKQNKNN